MILAEGGGGIVVPLVFIDHLFRVQTFLSGNGIRVIDTFYRTLLILVRPSPRNRTVPVQMRSDRFPVTVFRDLEQIVASISRVRQAFTDNRVSHIINELAIFGVRYLCLIHPERVERDPFRLRHDSPQGILVGGTHLERTSFNQDHSIRRWFIERYRSDTCHLTAGTPERFTAGGKQGYRYKY